MNQFGLTQHWGRLAPREQLMVAGAVAVVSLALLWWLLLAPPLATLRGAEAQHRALDGQLQRMRALQSQAQLLQSQSRQTPEEATRLLEATVRTQLALTGRMSIAGERVTVTLAGTSPQALSLWLLLMAPMSVFLSSGSPTTRERMRCLSLRITSSYTPSSTKRRLPAQHTWPWLK